MTSLTIAASKALIAVLLVGAVTIQTIIIPVLANEMAMVHPEVDYLQIPITVLAVLVLAGFEVVLLCIWKLLSMVHEDSIFSGRSFRYVNIIVGALLTVAVLLIAILVVLMLLAQAGGPGVMLALLAGIAGSTAVALVVVVMRGLLKKATQQQSYLTEVV